MMKKKLLYSVIFLSLLSCNSKEKYRDPSLPIDERVEDLISRMTIEEKAAQLDMLYFGKIAAPGNTVSEDSLKKYVDRLNIGAIHDLYPDPTKTHIVNQLQKRALEKSRLGIPFLVIEEGLHGYQGEKCTAFPIPIGNSCTWDTLLVNKIGKVIGTEARVNGVHFILGPNLDIAHEIRWGRVEETFGEDPYLTSRMAVNIIKGMQGNRLSDPHSVVAEPKHFAIHGIPNNGTNCSSPTIGEREARMTHLYTFEKAITEGDALGVMAAYNDIDGIPCSMNKWLLTDVLRNEWGFKGMVVSDLGAVDRLVCTHHTAKNPKEAVYLALKAGLSMQFYDFPNDVFQNSVIELVKEGTLDEKIVDKRVADVLRVKFQLGLFENPYVEKDSVLKYHHCEAHRDLALKAAEESLVLLKNKKGMLPFNPHPKRITVVGDLANISILGGYSPRGARAITVLEALKKRFGDSVEIDFIESENKFKSIPLSALYTGENGQHGLKADYYNNRNLKGDPIYSTIATGVTSSWHNLSPAPGISPDNFSVRWEGILEAPISAYYEFKLKADDKAKLFLNGKMYIDQWNDGRPVKYVKRYFEAGSKIPIKVEYAEYVDNANITLEWHVENKVQDTTFFNQVTRSSSLSDLTIFVLGEGIDISGEHHDRSNLNMKQRDIDLLKAIQKSGKPAATVVMHGRPFVMTPIDEYSDAVLDVWYPGESGGIAILNALFGDINPSGKLCISIPRSQGQLPVHYLRKRNANDNYEDNETTKPLYPFGHGLSYTTFEYSDLKISSPEIGINETLDVTCKLKNTGKVKGTEVCQLYLQDRVSSVTVFKMALKGFARVELEPGEEKVVAIKLNPEHFSLINSEMKRVVEPGRFNILVGTSSADIKLNTRVNLK